MTIWRYEFRIYLYLQPIKKNMRLVALLIAFSFVFAQGSNHGPTSHCSHHSTNISTSGCLAKQTISADQGFLHWNLATIKESILPYSSSTTSKFRSLLLNNSTGSKLDFHKCKIDSTQLIGVFLVTILSKIGLSVLFCSLLF